MTVEGGHIEIFYLDDMEDEIFITQLQLRRGGLDLDMKYFLDCNDLIACLEQRAGQREPLPALIVTDLNMPGLGGLRLIPKLKADARYHEIMIGACTGSENPADKVAALDAGADFFVIKPFDRIALERVCRETSAFKLLPHTDGKERLAPADRASL